MCSLLSFIVSALIDQKSHCVWQFGLTAQKKGSVCINESLLNTLLCFHVWSISIFKHRCTQGVYKQTCWLMNLHSVVWKVWPRLHQWSVCKKVWHHKHSLCNLLFTKTMHFIKTQTQILVTACSCTLSICLIIKSYTWHHAPVHLNNLSIKYLFISSDLYTCLTVKKKLLF